MSQALPGVWYAKRRKTPCFLYVTDLWPESVEIIAGVKNKLILGLIGKMVDYIYKRCDRIFASSMSFTKAIGGRGVPSGKIKFWPSYAEDFYIKLDGKSVSAPEIPRDGRFNVLFAGNIGFAQGLEILPQTAFLLKQRNAAIRFNIVGDGRFKAKLIRMIQDRQIDDMFNLISIQPPERIPEFMAVCDAALICLSGNKAFSMTIPSKMQSCLACGKPIIASCDGEVGRIVSEANAGVVAEPGNPAMLADKICEMKDKSVKELAGLGLNGYEYYRAHFDKKMLMDEMDGEFLPAMKK